MTHLSLADLGWSAHFRAQLTPAELESSRPARIETVARDRLRALSEGGALDLRVPTGQSTGAFAVGDWVLADPDAGIVGRLLDRQSLLQRRAAGTDARTQLIASNVDTLAIVTSCNDDFNVARIERYVALASASSCLPLVILTKADTCDDVQDMRRKAEAISPMVAAVSLDARNSDELESLAPWCKTGQTLALVGSSGVGKTTLTNGLCQRDDATQGVREDDAKGRHTTTARSLRRTVAGGWLIDTPGIRALRLAGAEQGVNTVFEDIATLAESCRFSDCQHENEPGCAVGAEIEAGHLDPQRLTRWKKLLREDARNSETLAESRERDRAFGRLVRDGQSRGRHKRGSS